VYRRYMYEFEIVVYAERSRIELDETSSLNGLSICCAIDSAREYSCRCDLVRPGRAGLTMGVDG